MENKSTTPIQLKNLKITIGADHGGYDLKQQLISHCKSIGIVNLTDVGTHNNARCDYPDIAGTACSRLDKDDFVILVCGTGIGISIAANKIQGVRAALCHSEYDARMARQHNNANVIVFGGRTTGEELAKSMLDTFFSEIFIGKHHADRVTKIHSLEGNSIQTCSTKAPSE